MDSRKCQTATASPAEPGELPVGLGWTQQRCHHGQSGDAGMIFAGPCDPEIPSSKAKVMAIDFAVAEYFCDMRLAHIRRGQNRHTT